MPKRGDHYRDQFQRSPDRVSLSHPVQKPISTPPCLRTSSLRDREHGTMPLRAHFPPVQRLLAGLSERNRQRPRLTIFGRSLLLLGSELAVNALCWVVAGILFGRKHSTRPILSLALLSWVSYKRLQAHSVLTFLPRLM